MNKPDVKKLILLNLPYVFAFYFADKIAAVFRLAPGTEFIDKLTNGFAVFGTAFANPLPSFHPVDLLIGLSAGVLLKLAVYVKGKNRKKFRQGEEYGSARWGKADWIVGINGTRLFTTLYHKKLVVGRVQTPTLAMLVERDGKISTFQKEKYFNVHVGKGDLIADLEKVKTEEEAKKIAAACEKKQAVVSSLKREAKTVNPPKLYDLTTLQREANRYYGFTAQQTLDLVQTLYEKKLLTYPRTDSQFITDDTEGTARQVITIVCRQLPLFSDVSVTPDIARVTDNSKVTDHHAILPTVQLEKQDVSALPQSEQKILNLVGMRLLCATGEKHTYAETQITLSCESYEFKTKGKTVVQNGWKAIEELFKSSLKTKEKDDPMKSLPEVHEGDVLDGMSASVTEHFTTPPKQYTDVIFCERKEWIGIEERSSA